MLSENVIQTDVLVIGAGMAGMVAAIKAKEEGLDVILTDKGYVGKAGSTHFSEGDVVYFRQEEGHNIKEWMDLISKRGEYINNRDWGEICLKESKDRYEDLVSWGIPFYQKEGKVYVFTLGGSRTFYKDVAMINRQYAPALRKKALDSGVLVLDKIMLCDLLKQDGKIVGAVGFSTTSGDLYILQAKATVIATGSSGLKVGGYPIHFWTGDGEAMAYRAGAELASKEFMHGGGSRGSRDKTKQQEQAGKGTRISGEIFDQAYRFPFAISSQGPGWFSGPNLNVEGGSVFTTAWEAHCGRIPLYVDLGSRPPEYWQWLCDFYFTRIGMQQAEKIGLDAPRLKSGKIMWPASRVWMHSIYGGSGIWPIDKSCTATMPGLYAAGNSCATMASGAIYGGGGWGSNHAAVTGARAALGAAEYVRKSKKLTIDEAEIKRIKNIVCEPMERKGGFSPAWVTQVLQGITVPYFFLHIKHEKRLRPALELVEFLNSHIIPKLKANDAHEWRLAYETKSMSLITEMRLRSSLFRTESRGGHFREDYPRRDDPEWLAWVKLRNEDGEMKLIKEPVPQKWWPDLSKTYEERYPTPLPLE